MKFGINVVFKPLIFFFFFLLMVDVEGVKPSKLGVWNIFFQMSKISFSCKSMKLLFSDENIILQKKRGRSLRSYKAFEALYIFVFINSRLENLKSKIFAPSFKPKP